MHLWDQAMAQAFNKYVGQPASPQTLYRIKKEIVRIMRDIHKLEIVAADMHHIKVELRDDGAVNLVVPPNLLAPVVH